MARSTKLKAFFDTGRRGARVSRTQFHCLLTLEERNKLAELSHKLKLSAADVVRALIAKAK